MTSGPPVHAPGTVVRLRYKMGATESGAWMMPYHDRLGVVWSSAYGPGKRNLLVKLCGDLVLVNAPAGNCVAVGARRGGKG